MSDDNGKAPTALDFDPDDLTIEEIEILEAKTGKSLEEFVDSLIAMKDAMTDENGRRLPSAIELRALAFILKRRQDPTFTWEQAGQVKLSALTEGKPEVAPFAVTGSTTS